VSYDTSRSDLLELKRFGLLTGKRRGKTWQFWPSTDIHEKLSRVPSHHEEKMSDVNLAVRMLVSIFSEVDVALLVSGDSDFASTRFSRKIFVQRDLAGFLEGLASCFDVLAVFLLFEKALVGV